MLASIGSLIKIRSVTKSDCDMLCEELRDLINPEFDKWYRRKFTELNRQTVLKVAAIARADGNNPRRLFCYLLNKEPV